MELTSCDDSNIVCCAALGPLVEAAWNIVPVAVTAAESVERLRNWAAGRCLSADVPGIYRRAGETTKARRTDARDALLN